MATNFQAVIADLDGRIAQLYQEIKHILGDGAWATSASLLDSITGLGLTTIAWYWSRPHLAKTSHLHSYLQIAFEWDDYHLHEFWLHGATCDDDMRLDQLYLQSGYGLDYVYDLGDYWVHTIEIESSTPINPRSRYPRCTGGAQPGPEEDSGGAYAYSQKLARSRRAKAAAKKRTKNAGGTSKTKKKRSTSVRTFSQATVNRRLAAFCAGDPWYASA